MVQKKRIRHDEAGMGLFAAKLRGAGKIFGASYGSLVYSDLSGRLQKYKMYPDEFIYVAVDNFEELTNK